MCLCVSSNALCSCDDNQFSLSYLKNLHKLQAK